MSYKYARRRGAIRRSPSKAAPKTPSRQTLEEQVAGLRSELAETAPRAVTGTSSYAANLKRWKATAGNEAPPLAGVPSKPDIESIMQPFVTPGPEAEVYQAVATPRGPDKTEAEIAASAEKNIEEAVAKVTPVSPGKRYGTSSMRSKGSELGTGVTMAEIMTSKNASLSTVKPLFIRSSVERRRLSQNRRRAALSQRFG